MNAVIAVPVEAGEGLAAQRSMHFGHARAFVLVQVVDDVVGEVRTIENPPHEHGGCLSTVNLLVASGVTAVAAGGMGGGPLAGFAQAGVPVYRDLESPSVADAVIAIVAGRAARFEPGHRCAGH